MCPETYIEGDELISRRFLWDQESQLWDIFQDLDKNGDGKLDAVEMRAALSRSGIDVTPATVTDLIRLLATGSKMSVMGKTTPTPAPSSLPTSNSGRMEESDNSIMSGPSGSSSSTAVDDMYITFQEFRDFLIMLPRKATPLEIYKCKSFLRLHRTKLMKRSLPSPETI